MQKPGPRLLSVLTKTLVQSWDFNPGSSTHRPMLLIINIINENTNEPVMQTKGSRCFFSGFLHFYAINSVCVCQLSGISWQMYIHITYLGTGMSTPDRS